MPPKRIRFRLGILGEHKVQTGVATGAAPPSSGFDTGRMRDVLTLVAEKSSWNRRKLPPRTGMALYYSHLGYFAEVVQAAVAANGQITVQKVWVAGDVGGHIINPTGAEAQVQGSVIDGIGAALGQAITIDKGRVLEENFDGFPLIRTNQAPHVEMHFLVTNHPTTGLGELALPPVIPALCKAIFAATGKRVRSLPIKARDLRAGWGRPSRLP